jgi:hypothetical protein
VDALEQQFGGGAGSEMMMLFMAGTPLRKFAVMGVLTEDDLDGLIAAANGDDPGNPT